MPCAQDRRKETEPSTSPLNLVQSVEHAVGAVHGQREFIPVRLGGNFRVVATNLDDHIVGGDGVGVAAGPTLKQLDGFRFGEFVSAILVLTLLRLVAGGDNGLGFRIADP